MDRLVTVIVKSLKFKFVLRKVRLTFLVAFIFYTYLHICVIDNQISIVVSNRYSGDNKKGPMVLREINVSSACG